MRTAPLLLTLLAGCPPVASGGLGDACQTDADCNELVCANTHECLTPDQVHAVRFLWTVRGAPADSTSCAGFPTLDLTIEDVATAEEATYSPVDCTTGSFAFPKLPTRYGYVYLVEDSTGAEAEAAIPSAGGDVALDLP